MKSIVMEVLGGVALPAPLDDTLSSPTQFLNGTSLEQSGTRQKPSRRSKKCPAEKASVSGSHLHRGVSKADEGALRPTAHEQQQFTKSLS